MCIVYQKCITYVKCLYLQPPRQMAGGLAKNMKVCHLFLFIKTACFLEIWVYNVLTFGIRRGPASNSGEYFYSKFI